ncbi:MAG: hypothetical protein R3D59_01595 [Paracoccaceae bacterium]
MPADAVDGYEDSSIGDFVYIAAQPEGTAPIAGHAAHPVDGRSTLLFDIRIPADHPKGIFWFHPHPHMLSKKQVSGGVAKDDRGGRPLCLELGPDGTCARRWARSGRSVGDSAQILLEGQPDRRCDRRGRVDVLTSSRFCGDQVAALNPEPFCGRGDRRRERTGEWVFSLNVANPGWRVAPDAQAEVWRIRECVRQHHLQPVFLRRRFLDRPGGGGAPCDDALPVQVLSLDGRGLRLDAGARLDNVCRSRPCNAEVIDRRQPDRDHQ